MTATAYPLFAGAATALAARVDSLFFWVCVLTFTVAAGIFAVIVAFVIRYRFGGKRDRLRAPPARRPKLQRRLEIAWSTIPLLLFLGAFAWAAELYFEHETAPLGAAPVFVVAKQWMWKLEHQDGVREIDTLHVPLGQPVRLVMTSEDVIHSFYVPAFRIKQDVLPGRYTSLWFTATREGRFHLFCSEYCGTDHAQMGGDIVVTSPAEYQRWLARQADAGALAQRGAALLSHYGCDGCHASASARAPSLAGLYGHRVRLADGSTIIADENFLRQSLMSPRARPVAGYPPIMPSYAGQMPETDLADVIVYLASLADRPGNAP
jgi:cytochrome c oxidase subunit 2